MSIVLPEDYIVRIPANISSLDDFRRWVLSDDFPEWGRIDYIGGNIELDLNDQYIVIVPAGITSLAAFRQWVHSDEFPEQGRIDFIDNHIEVDMSPEELYSHGKLKGRLYATLLEFIDEEDLGDIFIDRTRVSFPSGESGAEPDILFLSHETIDSGRVGLVPKATAEAGRFVEIAGPPDMIAEVVSDSSVSKDFRRLPTAYFTAGVQEYWLADARGANLLFQIHCRGEAAFEPITADAEGFQYSSVFQRSFRLLRGVDRRGNWKYDLQTRKSPTS